MPTVPKLNQPIQQAAQPGVRVDTNAPLEAFGGGRPLAESTQAIQGLNKANIEFMREEKAKADDLAVQNFRADALQKKNSMLWDPERGAFNKKGKDALNVEEEYAQVLADELKKSAEGLANEDQRAAARRINQELELETRDQLRKHAFTETLRWDEESTSIGVKNSQEDGILNWHQPGKTQRSVADIQAMVMKHAQRHGKTPEWIEQQTELHTSGLYVGTVNQMLAQEQDELAESFFQQHKESILSDDRAALEIKLGESRREFGAKRKALELWEKTQGNYPKALEMALKQEDSKKDLMRVKDWLEDLNVAKEGQAKQSYDQLYQNAANHIEQHREKPDMGVWLALKPQHQSALAGRLKAIQAGTDVVTDPNVLYQLHTMAAHPATRNKFLKEDLRNYTDKLKPADWKEVVKLQTKLLSGDEDFEVKGVLSNTQIINRLLDEAKIKNKDIRAQFATTLHDRVVEFEEQNKRRTSVQDRTQLANQLMKEYVISDSPFWPGATKKKTFQIEASDIPSEEREALEASLQAEGIPVTDETLRDAYIRLLQFREGQ